MTQILNDDNNFDRPTPIDSNIDLLRYNQEIDPKIAVKALLDGNYVLVEDFYSSGLSILNSLKVYLSRILPDQSFMGQRDSRTEFRKFSNYLLLIIRNSKLTVKKAPEIGWFKILYPGLEEFLLPFPQVQGLNSSWQWYINGITVPGLNRKIHPYFGTYFPTRFEHINLFDSWLKQYRGEKISAIDIGIGCGVLSLLMLKNGIKKIYGTDSNRNAIIGLTEEITKAGLNSKIELLQGDLFAGLNIETELIVFNPPWLSETNNYEGIDKAIYYNDELFPRFFSQAVRYLKKDGRVVLLFSNLGQITNIGSKHPIEKELAEGGRFKRNCFFKKKSV